MKPESACPECGKSFPQDAPMGLCPACLMGRIANSSGQTVAAESEQPTEVGRIHYFGDYIVEGEIARGGMGVVYRARQISLDRPVALKTILPNRISSPADIQRFRTEARAAANLSHPAIVAIHEVGEFEGQQYFSMELVDGPNLAEAAASKPFGPQESAKLLLALADAVQHAHERGVLHRDLKPQNILLDPCGRPRVTDFGLARSLGEANELTQTGAILGSPAYMSPEQAQGRLDLLGPQTDIYGLGAILYHLLTGKAPFKEATPLETLRVVIEKPVEPPSRSNPQVPKDLETICLKCLEKAPAQRYATAKEVAAELNRVLRHEPILARPAGAARLLIEWARTHPKTLAFSTVVGALAALTVIYGLWQQLQAVQWRAAHPGRLAPEGSLWEYQTVHFPQKYIFSGLVLAELVTFGITLDLIPRITARARVSTERVSVHLILVTLVVITGGSLCFSLIRFWIWTDVPALIISSLVFLTAGLVGAVAAWSLPICVHVLRWNLLGIPLPEPETMGLGKVAPTSPRVPAGADFSFGWLVSTQRKDFRQRLAERSKDSILQSRRLGLATAWMLLRLVLPIFVAAPLAKRYPLLDRVFAPAFSFWIVGWLVWFRSMPVLQRLRRQAQEANPPSPNSSSTLPLGPLAAGVIGLLGLVCLSVYCFLLTVGINVLLLGSIAGLIGGLSLGALEAKLFQRRWKE